jgi:hypothetical protein
MKNIGSRRRARSGKEESVINGGLALSRRGSLERAAKKAYAGFRQKRATTEESRRCGDFIKSLLGLARSRAPGDAESRDDFGNCQNAKGEPGAELSLRLSTVGADPSGGSTPVGFTTPTCDRTVSPN